MAFDIFISYRRKGGWETAKHLYDLLSRDGYSVSFDIDTLRSGDFDVALLSRIDECTDFILIVDPNAFDRCIDPLFDINKDWLRQELAYALRQGKNIIPIMLAGVKSFPVNLPADIEGVSKKNFPEFSTYYFDSFYNRLKKDFLHSHPIVTDHNINIPKKNADFGMQDWDTPKNSIHAFFNKLFKEK